jgi:hypothetical protein
VILGPNNKANLEGPQEKKHIIKRKKKKNLYQPQQKTSTDKRIGKSGELIFCH